MQTVPSIPYKSWSKPRYKIDEKENSHLNQDNLQSENQSYPVYHKFGMKNLYQQLKYPNPKMNLVILIVRS